MGVAPITRSVYGCATHTRREADRLVQIADPAVTCQRLGLRVCSSERLDGTAWPLRVLRARLQHGTQVAVLAGAPLVLARRRSVVLRGVNVVDSAVHRGTQHAHGFVGISRWPEDSVAGQLHRAVPGPVYAP